MSEESASNSGDQEFLRLRCASFHCFPQGVINLCLVWGSIGFRSSRLEELNNVGVELDVDRDFHVSQIGLARSRIVALILRNGYAAIRPIQEFFRNTCPLIAAVLFVKFPLRPQFFSLFGA